MIKTTTERSPRFVARSAGLLYLLWFPLGIFGILYVPSMLIESGDMAATVSNITANALLFRFSIVTALIIGLIGIFLVHLLYKLLKPVNKNYAGLMVIFLLVAIPISFLNELNKFAVLLLLSGDYSTTYTTAQLQALTSLFLELHGYGIVIAQIFWGLWLFPLGYLIFKSGFLPRILGVLMVIAGFGYLIDSFIIILYPDFGLEFSLFMFWGELLFPLWLLIKGVNVEKWKKRAKVEEQLLPWQTD